jgi:large subunit ribosomal protein L9
VKKIETRRKEIERMERERREQQEALIKQLAGVEVTLERKANEQGHLFGSVSATDISKALQAQGFNINPDDVNLPGKLDKIEKYTVKIRFADDLEAEVKVWVAPDAESKALIDAAAKAKTAEPPPPTNYENVRK